MTTPNLDATGHWWVGALVKFNFQLEYQKGWDNNVASMLSWITNCLGPQAVQSVLEGVTLGATQRAEGDDPAVVEGDHNIEKDVYVAAGWVLVEMHVTDWAAAQREDPELDAVLRWLEAKKKVDLMALLGEHASSEEGWMVWRNCQNFTVLQNALCLHSMLKRENEDLLLFMVPTAFWTAALNGFHWDAGHRDHDHTLSLPQEHFWWPRMAKEMRQTVGPAHVAFSLRVANWPSHLAEIVHTYNATWSAVTGYSPHYFMFGHRPRLPVNFVFPTIGSNKAPTREASAKHVDVYMASVWLRTTLWEAQAQLTVEAHWQKWYYNRKIGSVNLKPGNLVLVKVDAFKGKRKIRDRWEVETWEVMHQIATDIPSYEVTNQHGKSWVLHQNQLLLVASEVGVPLFMGSCHAWDRCTSPTPCKTTSVRGERKRMPQENNGKVVAQWPTSKASLGWKNRKLQLLLWTSTGASTKDRWRPQVMWCGCRPWKEHVCKAEGMRSMPNDAGR